MTWVSFVLQAAALLLLVLAAFNVVHERVQLLPLALACALLAYMVTQRLIP